jgi:hypothetical protein
VRDAETGRRLADKLFRVWLLDGEEMCVLVHLEVQGQVEEAFTERMFVYHYRIFDRYRRPVASLAVLADDRPDWRPSLFERNLMGCRLVLEFPTAKLLDWTNRLAELEANTNPFAVVLLAHLASQRTRKDPTARLHWKRTVTRSLYRRGFHKQEILELFRFVDWLLRLPEELAHEFSGWLADFEKEDEMVYITQGEELALQKGLKKGLEKGLQKGLLAVLTARFGLVSDELAERVRRVEDVAELEILLKRAATVGTPVELFPT